MQNVLRNNALYISALIAMIVIATLSAFAVHKAYAGPSSFIVQTIASATTTVAYLGNGTATSTYQIDSYPIYSSGKIFSMEGIDQVSLYMIGIASSSATVFGVTPQFSNNGIDWYTAGSPVIAGGTATTVVAPTVYTWTPGVAGTSTMTFNLPYISGMHERVLFSASGAAGAIYGEVALKQNAVGQ